MKLSSRDWLMPVLLVLIASSAQAVWVPSHGPDGLIASDGTASDGSAQYTPQYWIAIGQETQSSPVEADISRPITSQDDPGTPEDETSYGDPVWLTEFRAAVDAGHLTLWTPPTTPFWCSGQLIYVNVQGHYRSALDTDSDGLRDDVDPFPADFHNNNTYWDGATATMIDGQMMVMISDGMWCSIVPDGVNYFVSNISAENSDGDTLPDVIDPYPTDSTNNSFYFPGGRAVINGITYLFRAQWCAGNGSSSHQVTCIVSATGATVDVPDPLYDAFTAETSGKVVLHWDGGTIWMDGVQSTFPPVNYYSSNIAELIDSTVDGTPDQYLGTDGATHPPRGVLMDGSPDFSVDSDGDSLPDEIDPYPWDSWNNSYFTWNGGSGYWIDGQPWSFGYMSVPGNGDANADGIGGDDSDGDSIPDVFDPYPVDSNNNCTFWTGGTFFINNVSETIPGRWIRADTAQVDTDSDQIPDSIDPYPGDSFNTPPPPDPATQPTYFWVGGVFILDGASFTWNAGDYPGSWSDSDNDNLPDPFDPYPYDTMNGNIWWSGGSFTIDGNSSYFESRLISSNSADFDIDGLPDQIDPYPSDSSNAAPVPPPPPVYSEWWSAANFVIDGVLTEIPSTGLYSLYDSDGDTIPNEIDPYPWDSSNNTANWTDGDTLRWIANAEVDLPDFYTRSDLYDGGDADNDGLPNSVDPFPNDGWNDNHYIYPPATTTLLVNNLPKQFEPTRYNGFWNDFDQDGIPDPADPYPSDQYNLNDTDSDGIPDWAEALYPAVLDRFNPNDAAQTRADGITYFTAYYYWMFPLDEPLQATWDLDGDGMSDIYELLNGLNPWDYTDALDCPAQDFVFNFQKASLGRSPLAVVTDSEFLTLSDGWPRSSMISGAGNTSWQTGAWDQDWDGDGLSNGDEVFVFETNAQYPTSYSEQTDLYAVVIEAALTNGVSATTLMNIGSMVQAYQASQSGGINGWPGGVPTSGGTGGSNTDPDDGDGETCTAP